MAKESKKGSGKKVIQYTITGPESESGQKVGVDFVKGVGVTLDKDAADWFENGLKWKVEAQEVELKSESEAE